MNISSHRQQGAVAVLVGVSLVVLVGIVALVVDLGRDYVGKTELQNAADAAALAGAKQLNGSLAGVTSARDAAIAVAGANKYDLAGHSVVITTANLWLGNCPTDDCMVPLSSVDTAAEAAGRTFMKVDTGNRNLSTVFAAVLNGSTTMQTFGMAVAGRYTVEIAPIGVCAVDPLHQTAAGANNELLEFGFRRGIAYNIFDLNAPLGGTTANSDMIWLNPVDMAPATCNPSNSNGPVIQGFLCQGTSALHFSSYPAQVYRNTGLGATPMERALNSRFDDFTGGNSCDPGSAPPDRNIKSYRGPGTNSGDPKDWTVDDTGTASPSQQSVSINPATHKPYASLSFAQYGSLWSYSHAVQATTDVPPKAGAPFTLNDWNAANGSTTSLYGGQADQTDGYPTTTTTYSPQQPAGSAYGTPYSQTDLTAFARYFDAPNPSRPGKPNRRVLNLAIIDCTVALGNTSCSPLQVVGVGRFFMQRPASISGGSCGSTIGNNHCMHMEFGGLVEEIPTSEVKLYR